MTLYEGAEALLSRALLQSKYKINFGEAVSFSIPSQEIIPHPALWELGATEDDLDDRRETEVLRTRPLTAELMKSWASSHPKWKKVNRHHTLMSSASSLHTLSLSHRKFHIQFLMSGARSWVHTLTSGLW